MGGCGSTTDVVIDSIHRKEKEFFMTIIGSTANNSKILGFEKNEFIEVTSTVALPRFCHALLSTPLVGYITGGLEEVSLDPKATVDDKIFEGSISRKCIRVNMSLLVRETKNAFEILPEMINSRYAHTALELDGCLYVLGGRQYGQDEGGLLNACEKFTFAENKWRPIPSLQYPRSAASALRYDKHIYVFGGYSGQQNRTRVIESFTEGDNAWRQLPFQMPLGLEGMTVLQKPNNKSAILIFGGKSNYEKLDTIFEINFDRSSIHFVGSMKQQRSFAKAKFEENLIWIFGGGSEYTELFDYNNGSGELFKEVTHLELCSVKEMNSFTSFEPQITLTYTKRNREEITFKNKVFIFGHAKEPFSKVLNTDSFTVTSKGQNLSHSFVSFASMMCLIEQCAK